MTSTEGAISPPVLDGAASPAGGTARRDLSLLLLVVAMCIAMFFRMYPVYLPVTADWAKQIVGRNLRRQARALAERDLPDATPEEREALVARRLEAFRDARRDEVRDIEGRLADHYADRFRDASGHTYLLGIDSYHYFGAARERVHPVEWRARDPMSGHVALGLLIHAFASLFADVSLEGVFFYLPLLAFALSLVPAFFLARRIGGDVAGLAAAVVLALSPALLARTPAGNPDTDSFNILFGLLVAWTFLEAWESDSRRRAIAFGVVAGLCSSMHSWIWKNWWYATNFLLAAGGAWLVYRAFLRRRELRAALPDLKRGLIPFASYLLTTAVGVSLFRGPMQFLSGFAGLRTVLHYGVARMPLWPQVAGTIAELTPPTAGDVIDGVGGWHLLLLGFAGLVVGALRRGRRGTDSSILFSIWILASLYTTSRGTRAIMYVSPAVAIGFGLACGLTFNDGVAWLSRRLGGYRRALRGTCVAIAALLVVAFPGRVGDVEPSSWLVDRGLVSGARETALRSIPLMNDAWHESLTAIRDDADEGTVTSWWDFGYWFRALTDKLPTVTGGNGRRLHWIGKCLLTDDEAFAAGILQMLGASTEKDLEWLEEELDGDTVRMNAVIESVVRARSREDAAAALAADGLAPNVVSRIVLFTRGRGYDDHYLITSGDMVLTAYAWAHLGSWDFERARRWCEVRNLGRDEGVAYLRTSCGLSDEQARRTARRILATNREDWVAPWPRYYEQTALSGHSAEALSFANGLEVRLADMSAMLATPGGKVRLRSVAFIDPRGRFEVREFPGETVPASAALVPTSNGFRCVMMDPQLAGSMFTRLFFFEGHGLKHFRLLSDRTAITNSRILVWKFRREVGDPPDLLANVRTRRPKPFLVFDRPVWLSDVERAFRAGTVPRDDGSTPSE